MVAAVPKSDNASAKAISPAARIAGSRSGALMLSQARHPRAPEMRAASSNSEPSQRSAAATEK